MPHETATITKDTWATFSARPAAHSIGGLVTVEPNSSAHVPVPSIVAPPAFPGLPLAIPVEVANQIEALTKSALDGAGLAEYRPSRSWPPRRLSDPTPGGWPRRGCRGHWRLPSRAGVRRCTTSAPV
jgi:hypothetical protein